MSSPLTFTAIRQRPLDLHLIKMKIIMKHTMCYSWQEQDSAALSNPITGCLNARTLAHTPLPTFPSSVHLSHSSSQPPLPPSAPWLFSTINKASWVFLHTLYRGGMKDLSANCLLLWGSSHQKSHNVLICL